MRLSGYIQKYISDRGFGFIAEHQTRNLHFFHITKCSFVPEVGQRVTFHVTVGKKGPVAVDVHLDAADVLIKAAKAQEGGQGGAL